MNETGCLRIGIEAICDLCELACQIYDWHIHIPIAFLSFGKYLFTCDNFLEGGGHQIRVRLVLDQWCSKGVL